ncbi:MAG: NTP transferase domain-containing protein [Alphaproteobacteria bacterium]|nr:NTP transferase domain-containing protein [Alphaproteobacteria bacterium]
MSATAFVLAAGLGTRLAPLTQHRPKALVPVCGIPMLGWALAACARHGHREVVVNAFHLADQVTPWAGEREGVQVHVVVERPEILGTGGGLRAARHLLDERVVVLNVDVLHDVDLGALLAAVRPGGAAMALRPDAHDADRYGHVSADATDTVVRLVDLASTAPAGVQRDDTHFTGLHALDRSTLALVHEGPACIVRTVYRTLVPQRRVRALRHPGTWLDVGDPAAYLAANLAVLTTRVGLPLDPLPRAAWAVTARGDHGRPPAGVTVDGTAWVGPDAELGAGVRLRDTVVGAGARVAPGADLCRCVVWDGAVVPPGPARDTVFLGRTSYAVHPEPA